tara:strand:- start:214 stop:582 length:369 start_codon:yes stop_codon:yes gene_type:complete
MKSPNTLVTVVTEPDLFFNDQPCFLIIGDEVYSQNFAEFLSNYSSSTTVYIGNKGNELRWLMSVFAQCTAVILDAGYDDFLTGLFIDKSKTYYYNNKYSVECVNVNHIEDPMDYITNWVKDN